MQVEAAAEVAAAHEVVDEADPRDDDPELLAPFFVQSVFFPVPFFSYPEAFDDGSSFFFSFALVLVQLQLNFFFFLLSFLVVQNIKIA